MEARKLLLISSSKVHGYEYLEYAATEITSFLQRNQVKSILFIPYALSDHDRYYQNVVQVFKPWGFEVDSIHNHADVKTAAEKAEAFFIGGGNTFLLLQTLYDKNLLNIIRKRVLTDGRPYIGSSAGTNVATVSINTTNDMPIVHPPSFDALKLVPFNINPHYLDHDEQTKHRGETREERIMQFLEVSDKPVLAMREGAHLLVEQGKAVLKGVNSSRLFLKNEVTRELASGCDVSFLLQEK